MKWKDKIKPLLPSSEDYNKAKIDLEKWQQLINAVFIIPKDTLFESCIWPTSSAAEAAEKHDRLYNIHIENIYKKPSNEPKDITEEAKRMEAEEVKIKFSQKYFKGADGRIVILLPDLRENKND